GIKGYMKKDKDPCAVQTLESAFDMSILRTAKFPNPEDAFTDEIDCNTVSETSPDYIKDACQIEWITFATKCSKNLNRLAAQAKVNGMRFTVLGLHTPWPGFSGRTRYVREYLLNGGHLAAAAANSLTTSSSKSKSKSNQPLRKLPKNKLVIVTDADDVILIPSCQAPDINNAFRTSQKSHNTTNHRQSNIFFSAETACWPLPRLWKEYPSPVDFSAEEGHGRMESPFQFINGGALAGEVEAVADFIKRAYYDVDCGDDQFGYTLAFLEQVKRSPADKYFTGKPRRGGGWPWDIVLDAFVERFKVSLGVGGAGSGKKKGSDAKWGGKNKSGKKNVKKIGLGMSKETGAVDGSWDVQEDDEGEFQELEVEGEDDDESRWGVWQKSSGKKSGGKKLKDDAKHMDDGRISRVRLDYFNDLFLSLYDVTKEMISVGERNDGRVEVRFTYGLPCIIHQNGKKTPDRLVNPWIVEKLGVDKNLKEKGYVI
ncbi:hypothetical protein HDU76_000280, partial [Blyttiomyces sp. JEL0837]